EAPVQALGKTARELTHGVLRPVSPRREADYQQSRPPFRDQALDGAETRAVVCCVDGRQRVGEAGFEISNGNPDAAGAEIEGKYGAGFRPVAVHEAQAWPA